MESKGTSDLKSFTLWDPRNVCQFTAKDDVWGTETTTGFAPVSRSRDLLNDRMDAVGEESEWWSWYKESFSRSMDVWKFSVENSETLDWEHTDWHRPDRINVQAKRELDELEQDFPEPDSIPKKLKCETTTTECFPSSFPVNSTGSETEEKALTVKRDWRGQKIDSESDWSNFPTTSANREEDPACKLMRFGPEITWVLL